MVMTGAAVKESKKASLARILVATDFSATSERALEYGISLARRYNSQIFVTNVITLDAYPMMAPELASQSEERLQREAKEGMEKLEKSGRLYGLRREMVIAEGSLWPTIEDLVKQHEIDLVIVGTHGMSTFEKLVIGSNAEQIFRQARVPVLTVGPAVKGEPLYEAEFKNILFATDFGPGAEREAAFAFSLAQDHHAKLTLLNVAPYAEDYSEEAVTRKRVLVTTQLRDLLPNLTELHCMPEYMMVIGEPVEEILRWAQLKHADLIMMGAKSRKGLAGHVPHTKAQRIISQAKCPVLTIKS
ncbi:MAG: universal stress protein [Candidatus Acidiferrales bacterium]